MENPGGERDRHGGTNKLERLSQRDSDLLDRDVIQNVGKRDADDSRKDENQVHLCTRMNRRTDFAKRKREGQQQAEVMKLTIPKLRIEPSWAEGRLIKTPYSAQQKVAVKAMNSPGSATC